MWRVVPFDVSLPGFIEVFLVDLVCPIFDCGAVLGAISPTVVRCREGDGLDVANAVLYISLCAALGNPHVKG